MTDPTALPFPPTMPFDTNALLQRIMEAQATKAAPAPTAVTKPPDAAQRRMKLTPGRGYLR